METKDRVKAFSLGVLGCVLWAEIDPSLGNVWYRIDHTGKKRVKLENAIRYALTPLLNSHVWSNASLWVCNSIIWGTGSLALFEAYHRHKKKSL
jgi:hypothetical protein